MSLRKDSARDFKETLLSYARSDLLCFRTPDQPELKSRQEERFSPLLDWAAEKTGLVLTATDELMPPPLADKSEKALSRYLDDLPLRMLEDLFFLTRTFGSIVLGLAVLERRLDIEEAFALSLTEELWQNERWGTDAEALSRRAHILKEAREFLERKT